MDCTQAVCWIIMATVVTVGVFLPLPKIVKFVASKFHRPLQNKQLSCGICYGTR